MSVMNGIAGMFEAIIANTAAGRIYATTTQPTYVAGEVVNGSIICEIHQPVSASGIDLKITGYEKTEWHDISHRTETINHGPDRPVEHKKIPTVHRRRGKKTFFQNQMRIYNIQGGTLQPGTYTFPFSYPLPPQLPGSFYERHPMPNVASNAEWYDNTDNYGETFADSDDELLEGSVSSPTSFMNPAARKYNRAGMLAAVVYKLKVTLDINGFFSRDLHARIPLIIYSKLEQTLQPAMQELTRPVTVCCCINKGNCAVKAYFDKLAYVNGETANVTAEINNQSTANLGTVVYLQRTLKLKSSDGNHRTITETVCTQKYEPVAPNQQVTRPMPLQLVGEKIKPTCLGEYVNCTYTYIVKCDVSMGTDINLAMPVTIYSPQPRPIGM